MDKLWVNVPSYEELEEGYTCTVRLFDAQKVIEISKTGGGGGGGGGDEPTGIEDAIYEPISGVILNSPKPIDATDVDSVELAKWLATDTTIYIMDRCETRKGIQILSPSSPLPWSVESMDITESTVQYNRGFFVDFMVSGPPTDINSNAQNPITFFWGSYGAGDTEYKFALELSTNEQGAGSCKVYERNPDYDSTKTNNTNIQWKVLDQFTIVAKDFFNNNHRIWVEPLNDNQMLIKNTISELGKVITTTYNSVVEVPIPGDEEGSTKEINCVYASSKFKVTGNMIAWFVFRQLEYINSYTISSTELTSIGYTSSQDFTRQYKLWSPDGLGSQSEWTSVLNIYDQNDTLWAGGSAYWIKFDITGPLDSGTTTTKRAMKLSDIRLKIPKLYGSNAISAVDLFASPYFCVESLEENRQRDDINDTLSFQVVAPLTYFQSIGFPKQNGRVQWWIDTEPGDYVRFDGYVDDINGTKFIDFSSNTYYVRYNITCKNRWKDAQYALFRGSYTLDGMKRSEIYELLCEQAGIPSTEYAIGDLVNDIPLANANVGSEPKLITKVGVPVMEVFKEIQKYYSVEDRLYFRDDGTGSQNVKLFIDNPDYGTVKQVYYRDALTANSMGAPTTVIASSDGSGPPMKEKVDDKEFFNDFIIVGWDNEKAFYSSFSYPPSWLTPTDPLYIRKKRTMLKINPAWNTQEICNLVGYALFTKFCRFQVPTSINTFLYPNVYPNDIIQIDAGNEPGASTRTYRVLSMRSAMAKLTRPAPRRYTCALELELIG